MVTRIPAAILVASWISFTAAHGADDSRKLTALQQRIARLEAGVVQAESIRAVKRLQNSYGHYAELGLWNDLADLFADNAVGYYPAGKLNGKEAIRRLFLNDIGRGKIGLDEGRFYPHIMLQPVITLAPDGEAAQGRWRVLAMLGGYGGNATWASGIYENQYVRRDGVWKIADLHYYSKLSGSYGAEGWKDAGVKVPYHYDAVRAGVPTLYAAQFAAAAAADFAALSARWASLAQRVERLHDEAEVTNLQHSYGYFLDRKLWDQAAALFAGDATLELGQQGVYAGKTSIRRAFDQFGPQGLRAGEVSDHLQLQTVVHVASDGNTATARGVELVLSGHNYQLAQWEEGIFENRYVKQGGAWKIQSLHFYPRMITDYDKGWAKNAKPAPGPSKDYPPDRPPTETYEIYPKFYSVPFQTLNPPQPPPAQPALGTLKELETRLAQTERRLEAAKAYDAAENLASAYGYYADDSQWDAAAGLFANGRFSKPRLGNGFAVYQIAQPVIQVAPDGAHASMRVRLLQLSGTSGGSGAWTAGVYEGEAVKENGVWKLRTIALADTWTASYREGAVRAGAADAPAR